VIEKFIIRQPPMGEKDDYDSENSWISDGLPSSTRRRRRGGGRWESGERNEVQARSMLTSTAPKARSRSGAVATLDEVARISLSVIEIAVIAIAVVVVGHLVVGKNCTKKYVHDVVSIIFFFNLRVFIKE